MLKRTIIIASPSRLSLKNMQLVCTNLEDELDRKSATIEDLGMVIVENQRVKLLMPPDGQVSIFGITDKQYGEIMNFNGKVLKSLPTAPRQLELF